MKNKGLIKPKYPGIYIDKTLDEKYAGKVLFKEKLDEANRVLKTYGVPKSAQVPSEKK
ncbi:hypothetical protein [Niastella sp. OAS944]|uniref:hypothetical protein n=1 Tax=Niastella sp. OAS944 TaxID=2664089 RepID=UPI0034949B8C|nr:hypothetical protein [Chitinophagaceae bacterium OAS944]